MSGQSRLGEPHFAVPRSSLSFGSKSLQPGIKRAATALLAAIALLAAPLITAAPAAATHPDEKPWLALVKLVDNGATHGLGVPEDWTLTASSPAQTITGPSGSAAVSGVQVEPGIYTLSESGGPSGYRPAPGSARARRSTTATRWSSSRVTKSSARSATPPSSASSPSRSRAIRHPEPSCSPVTSSPTP